MLCGWTCAAGKLGKSNRVDLVIISGVKRGRARWERLDLGDMWEVDSDVQ